MRTGVAVSVIAHAVLIAWGLLALTTERPLDTSNIEAVPVSLVEIGKVTAAPKSTPPPATPTPPTPTLAPPPPITAAIPPPSDPTPPQPQPAPATIAKADPPPPTPTPPPTTTVPKPAVAPPVPTAPVVAKADPQPVPKPATLPTPAAKPATPAPIVTAAIPPVPTPKPRVVPTAPAAKPAKPTDAPAPVDPIAAAINQSPPTPAATPAATPKPSPPQPPAQPAPDTQALDTLITTANVDQHMTVSEVDALRSRIAACWTPPSGWTDPSEVRVVLIISLNADGSVSGAPQIVSAPNGKYQQTAPESAVRAVLACAPYTLPPDKYEDWKEVQITFDPNAMATG